MNPENGISPEPRDRLVFLNLVSVERVKEERGADSLVQVLRGAAKLLELAACLEFLGQTRLPRQLAHRAIPDRGIGIVIVSMSSRPTCDMIVVSVVSCQDCGDVSSRVVPSHRGTFCSTRTIDSSRRARIRSRSTPASARATWASTTPNFTPRL